jgi:hypothetical protein
MLAFEAIAKPLLFCHLVAAACALAACIHLTLRLARLWRAGTYRGQVGLHARILLVSYACVFTLGGMLYPTYRIRVRRDYLEAAFPAVQALFEIKEHFASVGMMAVLGVYILAHGADFRNAAHRRYLPLWLGLLLVVLSVLSFNTVTGWYLVSVKSV